MPIQNGFMVPKVDRYQGSVAVLLAPLESCASSMLNHDLSGQTGIAAYARDGSAESDVFCWRLSASGSGVQIGQCKLLVISA